MTSILGAGTKDDQDKPIGVIDIGSNSVRMLIYERLSRNPSPLFNEKVHCGLGRSLASTGKLDEQSVSSAISALERFRAIATQVGVDELNVIATAAARDAKNADEFIEQATKACGGPISILSGKDEAKLAAKGILAGFSNPDGLCGDLGGGSLEFTDIENGKLGKMNTLPLGGLRLIDQSGGDIKKAEKIIDEQLDTLPWIEKAKNRPFYAIGGTWRAFAKVHIEQTDYPLRITHGYTLTAQEAVEFAKVIRKLSPSSIEGVGRVSKARREVLPFGALILERLFQKVDPSELVVSAQGVREGLMYSLLPKATQQSDPLLTTASDMARLSAKSAQYCQELRDWTDKLVSSCELAETETERRERHAACLLSDVGWRSHPEYRDEQSLNMIAHSNLSGIDHIGRIFIGLSVFFRYGGSDKKGLSPLLSLATEDQIKRARILGASFRLAHAISAGTPGVILNTPLKRDGDQLILDLAHPYHILAGEKLEKRVESLAKLLDLTPAIDTASQ